MQYYEDGFYAGDPAILPADRPAGPELPETVDVLIVGSGPAGLVLAAQLARFPGITTRLVERKDGPMQLGQADGVACRTIEMFQGFGFAEQLLHEAYWVNETVFWGPDEQQRDTIVRTGRVQDVEDGLSEMPHVIMNQARIHEFLLQAMRNAPTRLEPDYGWEFLDLEVAAEGTHPVTVTLKHADGRRRTVRAAYVVGCDGARSGVRRAIGRDLLGDRANHAWGVMDLLATTDFPDIRFKAAIQSAEAGSILLIPREGGHLVRLYIDLGVVTEHNRATIRAMSAEQVVEVAERVLHPYTLEVKETVWFSVYEVAQRLTDGFDDVAGRDTGRGPRVFIAGDACHTHSAKAGQGMNVSMQDAFNLGWKLAGVLEGHNAPGLLETYSAERQPVAQELIDFDKAWSAMLAGSSEADPERAERVSEFFVRQGRYTAGVATRYRPSRLTGTGEHQHLAAGFEVGTRFHSAPVVRVGDGKRVELGHCSVADGRWRMYAFAEAEESRFRALCAWLSEAEDLPVVRYTAKGADLDALIDVRGIWQRHHTELSVAGQPDILRPVTGALGLIDYEKAFAPDHRVGPDIFDLRGVSRSDGALVVVRPDQYVAQVLPLDAYAQLGEFFAGLFLTRAEPA